MKITLDLPEALMREVKILATRKGRKLKDLIADLLRRGLETPAESNKKARARTITHPEFGIPIIQSPPDAPVTRMTVEELLRLEEQTHQAEDLQRGLPSL